MGSFLRLIKEYKETLALLTQTKKLYLLVLFVATLVACSENSSVKVEKAIERPPSHNYSLKELVPFWQQNAKLCQDATGADYPTKQHGTYSSQPCHDGDMTLFNGLLCAAGNQLGCDGAKNAQDFSTGEWYRSPRIRYLPRDPSRGGVRNDQGSAEFSPDMALGVQLYLLKTLDVQAAEKWFDHLHSLTCETDGRCIKPPTFCKHSDCGIRQKDAAALWQTANFLQVNHGMKSLPSGTLRALMDQEGPRFATHILAQAVVNKPGFSQNLPAASILLANMIGLSDVNITEASRLLTERPQNDHNAFFAYLYEGDTPRVRDMIREECPTPSSTLSKPFREWTWERSKDAEAWRESCMWDCLFAYEILDENYSTPINPPPGQCLIDDVILDQREQFVSSDDKLFIKPFKLADLHPKVLDKVKVFLPFSGHSRRYIDVNLPSTSGPYGTYDRGLRLEPSIEPKNWSASLTVECAIPSGNCIDGSWYTSIVDRDENGFYSFNGQIYKIENGLGSHITKSPVLKDFIHFDYFDVSSNRVPVTLQVNNAKTTIVSAYIKGKWKNKSFGECFSQFPSLSTLNLFSLEGKLIVSCVHLPEGLTYFYTSSDGENWTGKMSPLAAKAQISPWNKAYRPREDDRATNSQEVLITIFSQTGSNGLDFEHYLLSSDLKRKRILKTEKKQLLSSLWVDRENLLYSTKSELVLANVEIGSTRVVQQLDFGCSSIFKVPDSDIIYALCNKDLTQNESMQTNFPGHVNLVLISDSNGLLWKDVTKEIGIW